MKRTDVVRHLPVHLLGMGNSMHDCRNERPDSDSAPDEARKPVEPADPSHDGKRKAEARSALLHHVWDSKSMADTMRQIQQHAFRPYSQLDFMQRTMAEQLRGPLQMADMVGRIQEQFAAPFRQLELAQIAMAEQLRGPLQMADTVRRIQEQLVAPFRQLESAQRAIAQALRGSLHMADTVLRIQEQFVSPIRQLAAAQRALAEQWRGPLRVADAVRRIQRQILAPLRDIEAAERATWQGERDSASRLSAAIERASRAFEIPLSLMNDLPAHIVSVEQNDTVTCSGQVFTVDDVQDLVREHLAEAYRAPQGMSLEQAVERITNAIKGLKDSVRKTVLAWIVIPILLWFIMTLLNPLVNELSTMLFPTEPRAAIKTVKRSLREHGIPGSILDDCGLVRSSQLTVRAQPKRRSQVVSTLHFGQIVTVIRRRKHWTLIEWSVPGQEPPSRGWVFGRYLECLSDRQSRR